MMRSFALRTVLFLTLYLPLEDFLLKWVPVPYSIYLGLRQLPDALILTAALAVVGSRAARSYRFKRIGGAADLSLAAFVVIATVNAVARGGDVLITVLNLKALLRYVLVIYVLVNVGLNRRDVSKFIKYVYISIVIQIFVAFVQFIGPSAVDLFFFSRIETEQVAGIELQSTAYKEAKKGYVFGTMTNTISFAGFMIIGLATYLSQLEVRRRSSAYWGAVSVFLLFTVLSGSRASTFAALIVVGLDYWLSGKTKRLVGGVLIGLIPAFAGAIAAGMDLQDFYLFNIFSAEYLEVARKQRLGILVDLLPYFLADLSLGDVLFGLSADRAILDAMVADMTGAPSALVSNVAMIEDVYWVALPVYYGLVGLGLFVVFFSSVFHQVLQTARRPRDTWSKQLSRAAILLMMVAIPLNFVAQYFETRQFSFYLWLIVGLAVAYARSEIPASRSAEDASNHARQ